MTSSPIGRTWTVGAVLAAVILGLEWSPHFGPSRDFLRDGFGPEGSRDGRSALLLQQLEASGDDVGLREWTDAPSARAVQPDFFAPDQWLLSLAIPDEALHDPARGILAHRKATGRAWERVGWASLYYGREAVFTTRIGVRVHGGRRSGSSISEAFRLIFRPQYGLPNMPSGGPLATTRLPPDRMVVRSYQQMPQTQPIAFEISRRIGAVAPSAVPVRFVFNGALRPRVYELTEHVSRQGWGRANLGHDDFRFYRFKASRLPDDEAAYTALEEFVRSAPAPLRMAAVEARIDLDNFVRHLLTLMYCGTGDAEQGAVVLNLRARTPRWFWVHWDLDLSFGYPVESWRRPSITRYSALPVPDVRQQLFRRLLREDPDFKGYFTTAASETINHFLTRDYLGSLVRKYARLSVHPIPFAGFDLASFFERRGDVVLDAIADELHMPRPYTVRVEAPGGIQLRVDGHDHGRSYTGRYFHEQVISVQAVDAEGMSAPYWTVNGASITGQALILHVTSDIAIRVRAH